eukprot:jgi/Tetstr1/453935/TSEL_040854.t1
MEDLVRTLGEARAAGEQAARSLEGASPARAVDVREEFGDRLSALARTSLEIARSLTDANTDPVAILGAAQKLVNDTDSLVVRYRKVDHEKSDEMRAQALDILFGQPHGLAQIIRNACSGVYEGGNGGTCLPAVIESLRRTCDLQERLGALVHG